MRKLITSLILLISINVYSQNTFTSYPLEQINISNKNYISPYFILFINNNEDFEQDAKFAFIVKTQNNLNSFNFLPFQNVYYMPIKEGKNKMFISFLWKSNINIINTSTNFLLKYSNNIDKLIIGFTLDKTPSNVLISSKSYEDYLIDYDKRLDPY